MADAVAVTSRRTVGVLDIPRALVTPRSVFRRVEDVQAWGWPLLVLLVVVTLLGLALVETGLIDRQIEIAKSAKLAQYELTHPGVIDPTEFRDQVEHETKQADFLKLMTRLQIIAAAPASALGYVLGLSALLYGIVALTGRKPEWNTLLTICVFAAFADVLQRLVQLVLIVQNARLDVDTSPALLLRMLTPGQMPAAQVIGLSGLLQAFDPFVLWFWVIVAIGLTTTQQLRSWRAWLVCSLAWGITAFARVGIAIAIAQSAARAAMQAT